MPSAKFSLTDVMWVMCAISDRMSALGPAAADAISKAGPLAELKDRVAALPGIAKYLSTRSG